MQLPFEDASFDAATMGYGLRNVADIPASLRVSAGGLAMLPACLPTCLPARLPGSVCINPCLTPATFCSSRRSCTGCCAPAAPLRCLTSTMRRTTQWWMPPRLSSWKTWWSLRRGQWAWQKSTSECWGGGGASRKAGGSSAGWPGGRAAAQDLIGQAAKWVASALPHMSAVPAALPVQVSAPFHPTLPQRPAAGGAGAAGGLCHCRSLPHRLWPHGLPGVHKGAVIGGGRGSGGGIGSTLAAQTACASPSKHLCDYTCIPICGRVPEGQAALAWGHRISAGALVVETK